MSNIVKDRIYGSNKGKAIKGQDLIDNIFGTINAMSDKGLHKLKT